MDGEAMKEHFAQYGAVASTKVVQTNQSGRLVSSHELKRKHQEV
jgi:hypothetical protein